MATEQRFYALAQDNEGNFVMLGQIMTPDKSTALGEFRRADKRETNPNWYYYGLYYSPTLAIQTKQRDQSGEWIETNRVEFANTAARSR